MAITLYDFELSGNCYKVRLLLNILNQPADMHPVEFFPGKEHKSDWFLRLNPFGQLPVLKDDDLVLSDSGAILAYLAKKYDTTDQWFPDTPAVTAEILRWHSVADDITSTSSAARLALGYGYDFNIEKVQAGAHRIFRLMDEHLWFGERQGRDWLCSPSHPTTADIACFPYVMLSEEGGISRQDYPALRRWTDRVRRIPGFMVMSGIFPAGKAKESA
ncbi:glutathione S-transferase [Devosia sp. MC521]|uniref:glutathione S-transferase family protein n=1 Tax=Devosia sp. MC521 TaxID=2759954 RepID=UPI0015FD02EC|nr:glutathione S-transferase [Devosia sp. MC521]MBJ6989135.1 glutathione S-transferase [Devosia sp. MC521]QMW61973.1 glutathione S-transferase [Devosia sp. MC521]